MPLQRLEPCGSKDPCTVLRGLDAGNRAQLPDRTLLQGATDDASCTRSTVRYRSRPADNCTLLCSVPCSMLVLARGA